MVDVEVIVTGNVPMPHAYVFRPEGGNPLAFHTSWNGDYAVVINDVGANDSRECLPGRSGYRFLSCRRDHATFFTEAAGAFLAPGDQHEIPGRLHIQLLTLLVTDHCRFLPTRPAGALFRRAGQDFLPPR